MADNRRRVQSRGGSEPAVDVDGLGLSGPAEPPPEGRRTSRTTVLLAIALAVAGTVLMATKWADLFGGPVSDGPTVVIPVGSPDHGRSPIRLAAFGDVGTGDADERRTAELAVVAAQSQPFDALLLLGDNVYPNGDPDRLDATVFGPFASLLAQNTVLLAVLGNHDVLEGNAAGQVEALGMPGRWYAAEIGPVLVVALDSTLVGDGDQRRWLEETLAASGAEWTIVILHHPPFSAGYHGSNEQVQTIWVPILDRYDVDLVIAGHDHDYQRSVPIGGVTYVVSGAGARTRPTGRADFTAVSSSEHHFLDIAVWRDRIEIVAVGVEGPVDHFVIAAR